MGKSVKMPSVHQHFFQQVIPHLLPALSAVSTQRPEVSIMVECCHDDFKWWFLSKGVKVMVMAAKYLRSFWDLHFQDPIQFLADYLMKNNKKEESDKEETEDAKTDAWWTTSDFVILGGTEPSLKTDDWIPTTFCISLQWEHNLCSSKLIRSHSCL